MKYLFEDKESKLIQTDTDMAFTKTFEKFCKLYIMKNGGKCIYPESTFFECDCKCNTKCQRKSLLDKSAEYRQSYGLFLSQEGDLEAAWHMHRQLLQITNTAIERYNYAGYLNIKAYPIIR